MSQDTLDMKWAGQFIERIGKVLNLSLLYEFDNVAVVKAIEDVLKSVQDAALGDGAVQLQSVAAVIFINGVRVKLNEGLLETANLLRKTFEPLGVQELSIAPTARVVDLQTMVKTLKRARSQGPAVLSTMASGAVLFRRVLSRADKKSPEQILKETFARFVAMAQETVEGEIPATHRFRRLLQKLADASKGRESMLVALARTDSPSAAGGQHAAAVASLAMLLARELGLAPVEQVDMAMSGALHDVGWGRTQPSLEGRRLRLRTALGVGLRLIGDRDDVLSEPFFVATESLRAHRAAPGQFVAPLGAQLVGVACTFMSLVNPAAPAVGLAADRAMQMLLSNDRFDARIVRIFVRIVGLLPVGSVVELMRGRKGVVLNSPAAATAARSPTVRLLESGEIVDLAARGEQVVRVLAPWEYEVNPTSFVFS